MSRSLTYSMNLRFARSHRQKEEALCHTVNLRQRLYVHLRGKILTNWCNPQRNTVSPNTTKSTPLCHTVNLRILLLCTVVRTVDVSCTFVNSHSFATLCQQLVTIQATSSSSNAFFLLSSDFSLYVEQYRLLQKRSNKQLAISKKNVT